MITVPENYQITLPQKVRDKMRLRAGDVIVFVVEDGHVAIKRLDDVMREVLHCLEDIDRANTEYHENVATCRDRA